MEKQLQFNQYEPHRSEISCLKSLKKATMFVVVGMLVMMTLFPPGSFHLEMKFWPNSAVLCQSDQPYQGTEQKQVILNNGVLMPIVSAGTWEYNEKTAYDSVLKALKSGFRHVDTAYNYYNQKGVGKAVQQFIDTTPEYIDRTSIFVTTKVPGCGDAGISLENCGDDTKAVILENLKELNLSYVDLLLVHSSPYGKHVKSGCGEENCQAMRHQWKAMQHAFINKKARTIGISNFCKECIDCILSWEETNVIPAVNQIQFHVGMSSDPDGLVSYSESVGMVVQAYSPLGDNNRELISGRDMSKIARSHKKTVAQVSLKWVLQNNVTLVTKSRNPAHMRQNLDLVNWELSEDEMKFLDEKKEPAADPCFTCKDNYIN